MPNPTATDIQKLLQRIVSGGQTGVDRAALDAAIEAGFEHGGWCPRGRRAEDGVIDERYLLTETKSKQYRVRTRQNVIDSGGTLILYRDELRGGTELTHRLAQQLDKPNLLVDLAKTEDVAPVREWIADCQIKVLNIAGPRESQAPEIYDQARRFVLRCLTEQ